MFVRLLFLLLVALNLGAGAWLLFGHGHPAPMPPATDPGVPELRLWSEKPRRVAGAIASPAARVASPAIAATAPLPAAGTSTIASPTAAEVCTTLGPFTTRADMRAAMQTLSPHVARIQYREEAVRRSHGYWVYLPAVATREAALAEARQLAAKGIHDYYVVTAGDTQNTISLGLFNDAANANKRLAMVTAQGFPAELEQRTDSEAVYWLDYAVPVGSTFDWSTWLPDRNDLRAKSIDCFGGAAAPAGPASTAGF